MNTNTYGSWTEEITAIRPYIYDVLDALSCTCLPAQKEQNNTPGGSRIVATHPSGLLIMVTVAYHASLRQLVYHACLPPELRSFDRHTPPWQKSPKSEIKISMEKPALKVAAEVVRRLLPDALNRYTAAAASQEAWKQSGDANRATLEKVARAIPGSKVRDQVTPGHQTSRPVGVDFGPALFDSVVDASCEIYDSQSVRLCLTFNADQAVQVLALFLHD